MKSYVVATRSHTSAGVALSIIVYERLCALFGLIFWCLLGWVVARPAAPVPVPIRVLLGVVGVTCAVLVVSERVARVLPSVVNRVLPYRRQGATRS